MAKPIKETPILHGKEAERFIARVESNERRDFSESFARAKDVFDRFQAPVTPANHATVQAHTR